jgi:hypothetical protein
VTDIQMFAADIKMFPDFLRPTLQCHGAAGGGLYLMLAPKPLRASREHLLVFLRVLFPYGRHEAWNVLTHTR